MLAATQSSVMCRNGPPHGGEVTNLRRN